MLPGTQEWPDLHYVSDYEFETVAAMKIYCTSDATQP